MFATLEECSATPLFQAQRVCDTSVVILSSSHRPLEEESNLESMEAEMRPSAAKSAGTETEFARLASE